MSEGERWRMSERSTIEARYDPDANAAYVALFPEMGLKSSGSEEVAPGVLIDAHPSGAAGGCGWIPIGIELLNPKPRPRLARIAAEWDFGHLLDDIYAALDMVLGVSIGGGGRLGVCRATVVLDPSSFATAPPDQRRVTDE